MRIDPLPGKMNARTMVFSFDEKYAKYFSVLLASLFEHADRSVPYDLVVLYDALSQETMDRIRKMLPEGFFIRYFDVGALASEILGDLSGRLSFGKWALSTFYDLLVPLLMPEYKRVVYFDTDIIFCDDPGELFEMSFEGRPLIAVRDTFSATFRMLPDHSFLTDQASFIRKYLGTGYGERYFNAGVLVYNIPSIDMKQYRARLNESLAFPVLPSADQDVFNYIFTDSVTLAPLRMNLQVSIFNQFQDHPEDAEAGIYMEAADEAVVIHYTTHEKPWFYPDCQMSGHFWSNAVNSPFYEEILLENTRRLCNEIRKLPAKERLFLFLLRNIQRFGLYPRRKLRRSQQRLVILEEKLREYRKRSSC
jgi:lipopolysaccharide biosynthesis glycosyltransferase